MSWEGVEQGLVVLGDHYVRGLVQAKDRAKAARYALDFLAHAGFTKPWLLIFDNVEDPRVLDEWRPRGNVHVLVASRISNWRLGVSPIDTDLVVARHEARLQHHGGQRCEDGVVAREQRGPQRVLVGDVGARDRVGVGHEGGQQAGGEAAGREDVVGVEEAPRPQVLGRAVRGGAEDVAAGGEGRVGVGDQGGQQLLRRGERAEGRGEEGVAVVERRGQQQLVGDERRGVEDLGVVVQRRLGRDRRRAGGHRADAGDEAGLAVRRVVEDDRAGARSRRAD